MTTYTEIINDQIDTDSPVTQPLMTALRDNPLAISEGDDTAPRILLKALETLEAGNELRSDDTDTISNTITGTFVSAHTFAFIQAGTVRVVAERVSGSTAGSLRIRRKRNGTTSTVSSSGGDITADIAVLPGDVLYMQGSGAGTGSGTVTYRGEIRTNGQNLWPGSEARLENNNV